MVLTDLTFDHCNVMHGRYDLIRTATPKDDPAADSKEYASFLRALERKVGPDGFLDSKRYTYPYDLKKQKSEGATQAKLKNDPLPVNVVAFVASRQQYERDYQKKMKVIEDQMWQHKHEERELRHTQGDIVKNLLSLKHALQDYGNAVNARKQLQENKLGQSLEHRSKISRDYLRSREEAILSQMIDPLLQFTGIQKSLQSKIRSHQNEMAEERKQYIRLSHLENQYSAKRSAMEMKKSEMMRISQDFESKLRQNEEERHKITRELAELTRLLNMETKKARAQKYYNDRHKKKERSKEIQNDLLAQKNLEEEIMKSNMEIKDATTTQRKLDDELAGATAEFDFRGREQHRHLTDTKIRLTDNTKNQVQLKELAISEDQNLKVEQIKQKANRQQIQDQKTHLTMHTEEKMVQQRTNNQDLELRRKTYEDSVKHLQAVINKELQQAQVLSTRLRGAEYTRQQQDQVVQQLKQNLAKVKRIHDDQVTQDMTERRNREEQLNQQLVRERAELNRVLTNREENLLLLQKLRHRLREDKHQLDQVKKEHDRLCKIGNWSDQGSGF